jgi:hypothetical protein
MGGGGNHKRSVHIESIADYDNATSIDLRNAMLGFCAQLLEAHSAHPQTFDIVGSYS